MMPVTRVITSPPDVLTRAGPRLATVVWLGSSRFRRRRDGRGPSSSNKAPAHKRPRPGNEVKPQDFGWSESSVTDSRYSASCLSLVLPPQHLDTMIRSRATSSMARGRGPSRTYHRSESNHKMNQGKTDRECQGLVRRLRPLQHNYCRVFVTSTVFIEDKIASTSYIKSMAFSRISSEYDLVFFFLGSIVTLMSVDH